MFFVFSYDLRWSLLDPDDTIAEQWIYIAEVPLIYYLAILLELKLILPSRFAHRPLLADLGNRRFSFDQFLRGRKFIESFSQLFELNRCLVYLRRKGFIAFAVVGQNVNRLHQSSISLHWLQQSHPWALPRHGIVDVVSIWVHLVVLLFLYEHLIVGLTAHLLLEWDARWPNISCWDGWQ